MVRVPRRFVDDTLWPEFVELDRVLRETLERATEQVISHVFEQETYEAEVRKTRSWWGRWALARTLDRSERGLRCPSCWPAIRLWWKVVARCLAHTATFVF
jgi:hypothetical protein